MTGYTKLFGSIVGSTIWGEDAETCKVWITMLASADYDGLVAASIPGLAHLARVSIEACERALGVLQAPDAYSRTPENDGRRIRQIAGGWEILNYIKYQNSETGDSRRERKAEYMRKRREEDPNYGQRSRSGHVVDSSGLQGQVQVHKEQVTLPLNDGSEYPVRPEFADEMASAYKGVDVPQELRKMRAWLVSNPAKRKTERGIKTFINSWLARTAKNAPAPIKTTVVKHWSLEADKKAQDDFMKKFEQLTGAKKL